MSLGLYSGSPGLSVGIGLYRGSSGLYSGSPGLISGNAPSLYLLFTQSETIDPRITFTRASTAWRVNASGLIEAVSSNLPRIDYDPVTLACKGLLIEEQRTNLLLRSQEFDNASWGKVNTTVTADATVSPDGTANMDKLVATAVTSVHFAYSISSKAASSIAYAASVFLKAAEYSKSELWLHDGGGNGYYVLVDLAAGTIGTVTATGTGWSSPTAGIIPFGNGIYRVWVSATSNTATSVETRIYNSGSATHGGSTTGDGTSGLYAWGAQLETGSFTTSTIATTSATVTRAADVASITGTNFSSWFNAAEGTFVVSLVPKGLPPSALNSRFFEAGNAAGTTRGPLLYASPAGAALTQYRDAGVDQASFSVAGVFSANTRLKLATSYKSADFACVVNTGSPLTDASGTVGAVDRLTIGWATSAPSDYFNGWIERVTYYPARLSNALLQSLTA